MVYVLHPMERRTGFANIPNSENFSLSLSSRIIIRVWKFLQPSVFSCFAFSFSCLDCLFFCFAFSFSWFDFLSTSINLLYLYEVPIIYTWCLLNTDHKFVYYSTGSMARSRLTTKICELLGGENKKIKFQRSWMDGVLEYGEKCNERVKGLSLVHSCA